MKAVALTDTGCIRQTNQDTIFCLPSKLGKLPNLFMVADGMGGENAGDYASKEAVDIIIKSISDIKSGSPAKILLDSIAKANIKLYNKSVSDDSYKGMGTTLVAAYIENSILYTINVGDSRLYLYKKDGESLIQISKDHSYVEEMVLLGAMVKGSKEYKENKNKITRAIGIESKVIPDVFDSKIEFGDLVLLCSDGLSNMVEDLDIANILKESTDINKSAADLIELAKKNGGKDNISLILVDPFDKEVI